MMELWERKVFVTQVFQKRREEIFAGQYFHLRLRSQEMIKSLRKILNKSKFSCQVSLGRADGLRHRSLHGLRCGRKK